MTMTRSNRPFRLCTICLLLSVAAVTFTGCAHSNQTPDSMPAKEAAAMAAPESTSTPHNPELSAEEIGKRFLELIEGIKSRDDLNLDRVQMATGLRLIPSSDGRLYGYEQGIRDGWRAVFNFRLATASTKTGVDLHYLNDSQQFTDMSPVCGLDFDHYHNALKAMGFRDVPIHGEIGELRSWRYYRDDITLSIILQDVEPGEAGRQCIKSIGTLN